MSDIFPKITEQEHEQLINLQTRWNQLTKRFGELHYQKKGIESEIVSVDAEMEQLDAEQADVINRLQAVYGQGQVNLATGEFIPNTPLTM